MLHPSSLSTLPSPSQQAKLTSQQLRVDEPSPRQEAPPPSKLDNPLLLDPLPPQLSHPDPTLDLSRRERFVLDELNSKPNSLLSRLLLMALETAEEGTMEEVMTV